MDLISLKHQIEKKNETLIFGHCFKNVVLEEDGRSNELQISNASF
jgi:hypothetical protein